jgi:hypothetical protein
MKGTLTYKHYSHLKTNHQAAYFFTRENLMSAIYLYFQEIYCLLYYALSLSVYNFSHDNIGIVLLYDISVVYC